MFSLCLSLKGILSKLKIIIAVKGPLKSDNEHLVHIKSSQKANGTNKIRPEDSEKFENS